MIPASTIAATSWRPFSAVTRCIGSPFERRTLSSYCLTIGCAKEKRPPRRTLFLYLSLQSMIRACRIRHYFRDEAAIAGDFAAAARAAATGAKALKTAATLPSMRAWKRFENRRVEFNDRAVHERERSNKPNRQ